jgi:multiple sugar transport system substrate-binding protein
MPQFVNVDMIFMNNSVLQEGGVDPATVDPGKWEQMQELGQKLAKVEGARITRTGFDTKMQDGRLWLHTWANGGRLVSDDGKTASFNDPKAVEALTWAKAVVDAQGGEKARAAFQQAQNFFSPQNPVLIGQTAITVFENWLGGVLKVNPQFSFSVKLPRLRNSTTEVTMATGSAFAMPRGVSGAKRDAAWAFMRGMCSTDAWIAAERATFDANKSKNELYTASITGNMQADQYAWSQIYQSLGASYDQIVKLLPQALQVARFRYSGPVAAEVRDAMTAAVNDALQGVKEPKAALDELQTRAQQLITSFKPG